MTDVEPPGAVPTSAKEPVDGSRRSVSFEITDRDGASSQTVEDAPRKGSVERVRPTRAPTFSQARLKAVALSRGGANAVLINGWEAIDNDGDDFMTKDTFQAITAHLGISWDVEAAWKQAKEIDIERAKRERVTDENADGLRRVHEGDDQIHFTSYTSVFNVILGAERRNHRLVVKLGFEKLQRDSGDDVQGLTKRQVAELVYSCKKRMLLLRPAFDIEDDWKLMRKRSAKPPAPKKKGLVETFSTITDVLHRTKSGRESSRSSYVYPDNQQQNDEVAPVTQTEEVVEQVVDWDSFEEWWKLRMGLTETNVPVIPEYFSYKLQELGYRKEADPGIRNRLWWELRRRVELMVKMRQDWGHLQSTYGHTESTFGQIPIIGWVIDPDSAFSTRWDILQVLFLIYVTIFVPLRACFQTDVEVFSFMWFIDTIVDLYFIVDLFLNCFTAFDNFGIRETRHKQIVVHYLRTWFFFDLIACLPVQYIAMAVESNSDTDSGNNLSIVKAIRLVRLSKMLRLTRIKRILAKYEGLMLVQQYQGIAVLSFSILFASHFLACFWYLTGTGGFDKSYNEFKASEGFEQVEPTYTEGWVLTEWGNLTSFPDTLADIPLSARYSSSMYYVFNALENGTTDAERMFGVFSFFVVVMIDGAVAGVLSAMMISMGGADREITDKLKQAKGWMKEQHIPHDQALVALQYLQQSFKSKAVHGKDGVLNNMPPPMRRTFTKHLYSETLNNVPLFRNLSNQVLNALGATVKPMIAVRNQTVIAEGTVGNEMYMIISGELEIKRGNVRLGFVSAGGFFGEVPMLDDASAAEVRERTVTAVTDCRLVYLEKDDLEKLKKRYPELQLRVKQCARVGRHVNKKGRKFKEAVKVSALLKPAWGLRTKSTPNLTGHMSPGRKVVADLGLPRGLHHTKSASDLSDADMSPNGGSESPRASQMWQLELSEEVQQVHRDIDEMRVAMTGLEMRMQRMSSSLEAKLEQVLSKLDTDGA